MLAHLAHFWWLVALRGVVSILFGIAAFVYPGITIVALVLLFGAYLFVDGVVAIVQAIRFRHERERWPTLMLEGVLGVAIGGATFVWPGITALAWLYTIAAWAVVTGVLEIAYAIRLRHVITGELFVAFTGVLSIALGIALAALPVAGLIAWVWLVGAYAVVFGVLTIGLAWRLHKSAPPRAASGLSHAGGV